MPYLFPEFLTLVMVILVARAMGFLFRKMGQPSVMGEVLGGILLGPSVMGAFSPEFTRAAFHPQAMLFLRHVAEVGIILYLFVMGLEINLPRLQRSARSAAVISQTSILFPFALGIILAHFIFDRYAPPHIRSVEFSLFVAVAMSITAFPVLARILSDSPLHRTRLGDLALTCAAIDDLTAWCLVALVTAIIGVSLTSAVWTLALTVGYVFFMMLIARPLIERYLPNLERSSERLPQALLAFAVVGALTSATITDLIGIHAFFGAFLFGAAIPHDSMLARGMAERLQDVVAILFLPAFFALTGVKTQIGLLNEATDWIICGLIIWLAILGKFGGAFVGARLSKMSWRDSATIGILMNTRGLVELIVLNVGLTLGILTPALFTIFVIMALVTTFMTGPLLRLLHQEVSDPA